MTDHEQFHESSVYGEAGSRATNHNTSRDPLEIVLTEFSDEVRRGLSPAVEDYAERYPELAEQIRELFPLIQSLEHWKTDREMECMRRNVPAVLSLTRLGDYELVRELGRGGMGVVFEANHLTSQRSVAIKLLPWRFAADMAIWKERLQREAATIAALQHPNIVPVYSFSEDQGYSYYVMQLVDGIGLDKIIEQLRRQRRRFDRRNRRVVAPTEIPLVFDSWRGFASIAEQVATALAYAHEHGIYHNDIKPSNLLVRANRHVTVTDFGIGRLPETRVSDDHTVGTIKYMSPERLTGATSPQSDIYSLGATLYELATQQPLFDCSKRSQLIDAIVQREPVPPKRHVPDVPAPLEAIILKSIAKSPLDRYPSAESLAIDLRRFINREPVPAIGASFWKRLITNCIRWLRD
jgi:serine/threonine protein kinase